MASLTSPAIDLVIFDADGVLVDSETIGVKVLADAARAAGATLSDHEALSKFRGLKMADCVIEIERLAGAQVSPTFVDEVRTLTELAFEAGLKPIPGVRSALAAIKCPVCVASNGPRAKLAQTLRLTRLHRRFGPNVYSAYDIGVWKPDPGLFMYAAAQFGADPKRCLVVEDSIPGVRAAKAAGMRVFGYAAGDASWADRLRSEGAVAFHDMLDLARMIGDLRHG